MDKTEVQAVFDRLLEDEPPCERGHADVFTLARRIRRRRMITTAAAGIATAAVVVSGMVAVSAARFDGRGPAQDVTAAAGPSVAAPRSAASPAPDHLIATLLQLLPAGPTATTYASGERNALVRLTDTKGSVLISVDVQPNFVRAPTDTYLALFKCATRHGRTPWTGVTCHDTKLPSGTAVITMDGKPETPALAQAGVTEREVDTLGVDNVRILIREWNSAQPKAGPITRPSLMLSLAQLQAIALSPAWRQ